MYTCHTHPRLLQSVAAIVSHWRIGQQAPLRAIAKPGFVHTPCNICLSTRHLPNH